MRSVWSRLSSKEVLGEDCAGDSWPGQWSQLWLGWGRGLSLSLNDNHLTRSLHEKAARTCNRPDTAHRQTKKEVSHPSGGLWRVFALSHLVLVLAALFRLFHFLPDHEKGKNWQILATGDSWVVQRHSKSLVWAQKGKASIAEQLTRVRQSWQECSLCSHFTRQRQ